MSNAGLVLGLGPPVARAGAATVLVAAIVAGCYGAGATSSSQESAAVPTAAASPLASAAGVARPGRLAGRTWLAEGPRGWEAGQIGGRRVALPKAEVGITASDAWIVSAVLRPIGSTRLMVRNGPGGDPRAVDLGSLAPAATVIVGDRAYVSGFSFASPDDAGIREVDLRTGAARSVLPASRAAGSRYIAASPDGSTLVSSLCDLRSNPEPATCALTVVPLGGGEARQLGQVPGGLLRGTSSDVAVVAPQGAEPPSWIAGIDLATGRELWRLVGGEFGPSLMTARHGLIQQQIRSDGSRPRLVVEAVDLRTGTARTLYEETGRALHALWPALSSDTSIAIGEDATGSRALTGSSAGRTAVHLVPLDGGNAVDEALTLRSEP